MNTIQPSPSFTVENGLRSEHRHRAARGYWNAFARKLRYPLGPEEKAVRFIESILDPTHAISAVSNDGRFLGIAGFKTSKGALVGGGFTDMARTYGWVSALCRGMVISILERDLADETLLMDGIFVEPDARGQGVGKALLQSIETHAASQGLQSIRLDVIDSNPRARALYEREGYSKIGVKSLGPLRTVFGFSSATEMSKVVGG
ncbi:GNAT family N-acetyltransferase [Yoonia maritima]|uniref:GNAT family N-acetyltransferase n=1 Tax=Yoonia maritima TaxID=1435347 RepID=UPI000D0E865C|nr:GNAT family N-acetyltransferase [Yoonia maritima]